MFITEDGMQAVLAAILALLGSVALDLPTIITAVVSGSIGLAFFVLKRTLRYRWDQVDTGLETVEAIEEELPLLQARLHCPRDVEEEGGVRRISRPNDKKLIEFMNSIGHRPALHKTAEECHDRGLIRLQRILGRYHSYLGNVDWWEKRWWEGNRCVDHGTLLAVRADDQLCPRRYPP